MNKTHTMAPEYLPSYLSSANGSDPLFWVVIGAVIVAILCLGALYFRLHSIPEHLGEKHNNTQTHLISVLTVLALFTHNNIFWVIALILAVVKFPDFLTPLNNIAESLSQLAKKNAHTTATGCGSSNEPANAPSPTSCAPPQTQNEKERG